MDYMPEEQDRLIGTQPIYHCNKCNSPAEHPVLPPCGHLHCWKCVYKHNQCPTCEATFDNDDLFALFVDHGELEAEGLPLPPKPKPKYLGKIRNSGSIVNQGTTGLRYQDNLSQGVQLAGYGYCSPLIINSMGDFSEQMFEQEAVKFPWRQATWLLLLLMILMVLLG